MESITKISLFKEEIHTIIGVGLEVLHILG